MVMSIPFISVIEQNERERKRERERKGVNNFSKPDSDDVINKLPKTEDSHKENIICLSNLEEIVFYPCSQRPLNNVFKYKKCKPCVDYDKYLDFFE